MRILLLCCLALALGATEEKVRRRLTDALTIMQRIEAPGGAETLDRAVQALVQNGTLDSEPGRQDVAGRFRKLIEDCGKPTGEVAWVNARTFGRDTIVLHAVVGFRRGAAFARLVGYRAADGDVVLSALSIGTEPNGIFPPELLIKPE